MLPHVRNVEVWLGFELHGAWARWTAPLHWALFAVGAWAFARGHRWIWRAAPFYAGYVAFSHLVWNLVSPSGGGLLDGLWQLALFSLPVVLLLRLAPPRTRPDPEARGGEARRMRSGD
jgi:hypothetical protein